MFKDVLTTVVVQCKKLSFHSLVLASICCLSSIAMADDDDIKFSEIDSFTDFLEWVEDEFEQFKGHKPEDSKDLPSKIVSPENSPATIKEAPADRQLLDLSLPEEAIGDEGSYRFKEHQSLNMPDLFSKTVKDDDQDTSTTSFGGRLLMDEGFDELEQYRLQDIKNSIQGAELTFEVKTN